MLCTASLPIRRATSSPPRPTVASVSRNLSTKAWPRSRKKTRAFCGRNRVSESANQVHSSKESIMRKVLLSFLAFAFVIAIAIPKNFQGQTPSPASHLPRGTDTDISSAEVQALAQKTAADRVSDQAIRVVDVNGEYNVSIGVVHRAKPSGKDAPSGIEHAQITDVHHAIDGTAHAVLSERDATLCRGPAAQRAPPLGRVRVRAMRPLDSPERRPGYVWLGGVRRVRGVVETLWITEFDGAHQHPPRVAKAQRVA